MHSWGDEDFPYFEHVGLAAEEIGDFCRRWGRIAVTCTKEKWGTVRVYCHFNCCVSLHDILFPGWCRVRGPYRLMTFPLFKALAPLAFKWQKFIYRKAYERAVKKYPFIKEEILCCADYSEFLKGL